MSRFARIERTTKESSVLVELELDGTGVPAHLTAAPLARVRFPADYLPCGALPGTPALEGPGSIGGGGGSGSSAAAAALSAALQQPRLVTLRRHWHAVQPPGMSDNGEYSSYAFFTYVVDPAKLAKDRKGLW